MAALVRQAGSPIEKLKIPTPRARSESTAKSATNNLLAISLAGPDERRIQPQAFLSFGINYTSTTRGKLTKKYPIVNGFSSF